MVSICMAITSDASGTSVSRSIQVGTKDQPVDTDLWKAAAKALIDQTIMPSARKFKAIQKND